ncbi:MAG: hypothetical protein HY080_00840 [Gammaproteobacteria bacterium]|nr:hypothetical protein [Gammaproteobacteria bacterium]
MIVFLPLWLDKLLPPRFYFDKTASLTVPIPQPTETAEVIRCLHCRSVITRPSQAIDMAGQHHHVVTNPAGMRFAIVLFHEARGLISGEPTLQHTWFSGYSWQLATCLQCGIHLGWYFSQPQARSFYGLIKARLVL